MSHRVSIGCTAFDHRESCFRFAGIGKEERLAVLGNSILSDDCLGIGRDHKVGKCLCPSGIHLGEFLGIDCDDMVNIK